MATEEPVPVPVLPVVTAEENAAIVADLVVAPIEEANLVVPDDSVVVADEESKPKKVPAVPRKKKSGARTHPTYFEMIKEAIVTLKERNGSSQFAIAKFIEDNQKNIPANFRKTLLLQSKKLVVSGKLVKVKSSYKLPSKAAAGGASASSPAKKKKAAVAKPKTKKAAVASKKEKKEAPPAKTKVVTATKSKAAGKPAESTAKPVVKAKPAAKVRTLEAAATKPAKVQRTSTRSTPGNKPDVVVAKSAVEKSPVKKSKATKSPVKKAAAKKGKKK